MSLKTGLPITRLLGYQPNNKQQLPMYYRYLYLATSQIYLYLATIPYESHLPGQAPCGYLFGSYRKKREEPIVSLSKRYAPAGVVQLGN